MHAARNAIGADRLLVLVSGSPAVYAVRCGASMPVDDPAILRVRCSLEGVRERMRRTRGPGYAADPITWAHENIFHGRPFPPPTSVFDGVLIPDRELSADDAQVIS